MRTLPLETLTAEAFAPFGAVIDADLVAPVPINDGATLRHHALAEIDVAGAPAVVSIFVQRVASPEPARVALLERHPFGSQAFVPLGAAPWIVVVGSGPEAEDLHAFAAGRGQGVQIGRGVWHAPLICHAAGSRFLVVDRADPAGNVETVRLAAPVAVGGAR